jgi:hypothetical protein
MAETDDAATQPPHADLVDHLLRSRICGDVRTPRQSNLRNARLCAQGDPGYRFGLEFGRPWSYEEVVGLLAERVGTSPDLEHVAGADTIDPWKCVQRLTVMADRLALAAERRDRVLIATGHPTGVLVMHLAIASALKAAGCEVLTPGPGWTYLSRGRRRHVCHVGGVAMVTGGADLEHTHDPEPMRGMLDALAAADEAPPELVIADHGYAGAAGMAGIETVGFADSNDPALFVGEAEGLISVAVPLDDNVLPHLYAPLTEVLTAGIGPSR